MKKNLISALVAFGVMLGASVSWGQSGLSKALIGTPEEYQDYFVFNKFGNLNVAYWLVEINEVIVHEDSTSQNQLREIVRVTDRNFLKLDEKYVNIPLFVEVKGFTNSGTLVAQDDWEWQPIPYDVPYWKALCSATCVGPTYSYTINVQAEYDSDHNRTTNSQHHVAMGYDPTQGSIGNFGGNPTAIWRNFDNASKSLFCQLGNQPGGLDHPLNTFGNIDAPMHHGLQWCPEAISGQWDGVNFMFVPGSNNNGFTFHQHNGSLITAGQPVWRVRKGLGKWGEFADNLTSGSHLLYPNGLLPAPETRCGTMPQNGMIYGSALLDLWNPILEPLTEKEVNGVMVTSPFVCQQMAAGSGGSGGPTIYSWRRQFVRSVNYTGYVWSKYNKPITGGGHGFIFEMLTEIQNINLGDYNGTNSTGISWWPGDDVAMVQVYKVDHNPEVQMNEPITLMPSTLIDANGNLLPLNFTLHKGLYNVVFVDQNNNTFRVMIELENDTPHTLNKADMVSVNIFPNPIDSNTGQMSTTLESLINCSFNYTIVDANNRLYHQDQGHLNANDQTELILKTQNLPSGQLFHKFVFDDGSVKILQTLKD